MTYVVKFTHLEQTLFVFSHQLCCSLKWCLELLLWRKQRNITLWNATQCGDQQTNFQLKDKKKVEMMDVLMSVVLSHFHIVSMLLSVLKTNLTCFLQEPLNENVMRNYMLINFEYFVVLLYYMPFDLLNDLFANANTCKKLFFDHHCSMFKN